MYCKDCVFWVGGDCENREKIGEPFDFRDDNNVDRLEYSYNEGGYFTTGPMFGCVHFRGATLDQRREK